MKMKQNAEAISDRAFARGLWSSVICIVICLALLCSVTYAWFSDEVESDRNALISGSFLLDIQVTDSNGNEIPLTANDVRPTARTALLPSAGVYTVTLTPKSNSNARGYCVVTIESEKTFPKLTDVIVGEYTQNVGDHEMNAPFVFRVEVTGEERLTLEPCYGLPSKVHIDYGKKLHYNDFEIQY